MYDIYCSNSRYPCESPDTHGKVSLSTATGYPRELNKLNCYAADNSGKSGVGNCSTFNNNTVLLSDAIKTSCARSSETESSSGFIAPRSSLFVSKLPMSLNSGSGSSYVDTSTLKLKDLLTYDSPNTVGQSYTTMEYSQTPDSRLMVDDLEPQQRSRLNTWPLRPNITPPSIHDCDSNPADGLIKEEAEDVESGVLEEATNQSQLNHSGGQDNLTVGGSQNLNSSPELGSQNDINNVKKSTSRKNAWGNLSYADLITKAIQSSPEKKLTLSQIYDWMVQNVSYFRDKGDSTSSAGWKNSIRHNLSLHNRFMRIQNEGAGKSSWWVINPDAKPGKAPRRPRGGSMDNSKMSMKDSRARAMKRVEMKKKGLLKDPSHSPASPGNEFTLSPGDPYRERVSSFASNVSGRRSPDPLDAKLSPWGSEGNLDTYPNDFIMEGSSVAGKLHEDLDNMMNLDLRGGGSLLDELEEIAAGSSSSPYTTDQAMSNMYGKPYSTYNIGEAADSYRAPPPYPAEQNQQAFNKVSPTSGMYGKDPMMTGYNNGNNNSLSPNQRQYKYTNGMLNSQTTNPSQQPQPQQQPPPSRLTMMGPAPPNRVIPSSIRAALHQSSLPPRPNNPSSIPQSLKDSAPILTQQLMDYQPPQQQQQPSQPPQQPSQQQPGSTSLPYNSSQSNQPQTYSYGIEGGVYQTRVGIGPSSTPLQCYYPNDIDFNMEQMPELLSCDVDEVIKQELQMDGGQLDFTGFDGYSQQQNAGTGGSATSKSSGNSGNLGGIMS